MGELHLTFDPGEEEYLIEMRGLATDGQRRKVLVGLTLEESLWYMRYLKDRIDPSVYRDSDYDRFEEIHSKHETARFAVLSAENEVRVTKPQMN